MTGKLVRIPADKFFGFIRLDGKEYFFHRDDYEGDWGDLIFDFNSRDGEILLNFDIVESNKGPRAGRVWRAV